MLLRCEFDHAKRRAYLFADCPQFAKRIVLTTTSSRRRGADQRCL